MESVINVENFYFAYKKSDLVLRDINFEIKKAASPLSPDRVVPARQRCARL